MATYRTRIPTSLAPTDAFAFMADFSNSATWDPGVASAEQRTAGAIGEGTIFRLMVSVGGRVSRFDYEVVRFEPPHAVTFRAETSLLRSTDSILVEEDGVGSVVVYEALLEGKGALRLADAFLGRSFQRIGDRAAAGLRRELPPPAATS